MRFPRWFFWFLPALLVALALLAPHLSADFYRERIRRALETSLDRKVEIGSAGFSLLRGPGFTLRGVLIYDIPAAGLEPFIYVSRVEARVRLLGLLGRRLEFSALRLDRPSINLVKLPDGGWNFQQLLGRAIQSPLPQIAVNNGRLNFKLQGVKSVFYVRNTNLQVQPPRTAADPFELKFAGEPARTDRTAKGFGEFSGRGVWRTGAQAGQLNIDVVLSRSSLGELVALLHGSDIGIHGQLSGRVSFRGPLSQLAVDGRLRLSDLHRWDQLPPYAEGVAVQLRGSLNLPAQSLELELSPTGGGAGLKARMQVYNLLAAPRWNAWFQFQDLPLQPLADIARHMGTAFPEAVRLEGVLAGELDLGSDAALHGTISCRNVLLHHPEGGQIKSTEAKIILDGSRIHLLPSAAEFDHGDRASVEIEYRPGTPHAVDLRIVTTALSAATVAGWSPLLAGIPPPPLTSALKSGAWSGSLRYRLEGAKGGAWTGLVFLKDATVPIEGLSAPLYIDQAEVEILKGDLFVRRMAGSLGEIRLQGQYQFHPSAPRPHRLDLRLDELSADAAQSLLAPTLRRPRGLLARTFGLGQGRLPRWLADRRASGNVSVRNLVLAGETFESVRLRYFWDGAQVDVPAFQADVRGGTLSGYLQVDLRGALPSFFVAGRLEGAHWRDGRLSGDAALRTSGLGEDAYRSLQAEGVFHAQAVTLAEQQPRRTLWGSWTLRWDRNQPRLDLLDLRLADGQDVLVGQGSTGEDGQLQIELARGDKHLRLTGPVRSLQLTPSEIP
ncbi:MAG: AsmA family protein [Bryobacteraceae bacterium]